MACSTCGSDLHETAFHDAVTRGTPHLSTTPPTLLELAIAAIIIIAGIVLLLSQ